MAKKDTTTGRIPKQGTIVLSNPIQIVGKPQTEFDYDIDKVGKKLYMEAISLAQQDSTVGDNVKMAMIEFDPGSQLFLGWAAVIASDPLNINFTTLDRVSGLDLNKIMRVGRAFALGSARSAEKDQKKVTSTDTSDSTAEPTTQA